MWRSQFYLLILEWFRKINFFLLNFFLLTTPTNLWSIEIWYFKQTNGSSLQSNNQSFWLQNFCTSTFKCLMLYHENQLSLEKLGFFKLIWIIIWGLSEQQWPERLYFIWISIIKWSSMLISIHFMNMQFAL